MTGDEVKQAITGWCTPDNNLEFSGDRNEEGAESAYGILARGASGAPVDLLVLQPPGADHVVLRHTASASGSSVDEARKLLDGRPGWVSGQVDRADTGTSVSLETRLYHDGFSKNAFMQAVAELSHSARLLGGVSTAAAAATPAATPVEQPVSPMPSPQPMPAPSFSPQPQPQYQPQAQPQYQPQPSYQPQYPAQAQPATGGWAPTHSVPPQGLRAWASPDPAGPVVANLAPGLPIQVSEVRGAWARVICSNGWSGWIDGRIIGVAA